MVAPGFGLSFGDIVSGIALVQKLVRALNDTAGSRASYRHLISELFNLNEALHDIKNLQVTSTQATSKAALDQIARECQVSIEGFLEKNFKFSTSLGLQSPGSSWKTNLHKVQWALYEDSRVDRFQKEIAAHTQAIQLRIATIQLSTSRVQEENLNICEQLLVSIGDESKTGNELAKRNEQLLATQADILASVSNATACLSTEQQAREIQSLARKILDSNSIISNTVIEIQQLCSSIPPQVKYQQPVLFEDAHERRFPLHVELVDSFSVFQAVLEAKFADVPGLRKVKGLEYTTRDAASRKAIDISRSWERSFRPGRKLVMSIIFQAPKTLTLSCPGCLTESFDGPNDGNLAYDIQCSNPDCGIWFQCVNEIEAATHRRMKIEDLSQSQRERRKTVQSPNPNRDFSNESDFEEDEDEINDFRRVRIVHKKLSAPTIPRYQSRNPPCNTLQVSGIPADTSEEDLKLLFSKYPGYKRMLVKFIPDRTFCFVEFCDIASAGQALEALCLTHNSDLERAIHLDFAKNPLLPRT